jgi:hypothetical protein
MTGSNLKHIDFLRNILIIVIVAAIALGWCSITLYEQNSRLIDENVTLRIENASLKATNAESQRSTATTQPGRVDWGLVAKYGRKAAKQDDGTGFVPIEPCKGQPEQDRLKDIHWAAVVARGDIHEFMSHHTRANVLSALEQLDKIITLSPSE